MDGSAAVSKSRSGDTALTESTDGSERVLDKHSKVESKWWSFVDEQRFWVGLLVIGILLNTLVVFTSDLGLDTNIHMTLASEADRTGVAQLDWGHTRPIDTQASDPSYAPIREYGWFSFLPTAMGEISVRAFGWLCMMTLIGVAFLLPRFVANPNHVRNRDELQQRGVRIAAIVAIHPTFIFATGRVFPEAAVALAAGILAISLMCAVRNQRLVNSVGILFFGVSIPMSLILAIKGFNPVIGGIFLVLGLLWVGFTIDRNSAVIKKLTSRPLQSGTIVAGSVSGIMVALGLAGMGGTLSVIGSEPARFTFALLISLGDVILIYTLFGMVLWPFSGPIWRRMKGIEDVEATTLAVLIAGFTAAITIYIAALWTYEASLWNAPWPWVMWTMGNNARYISLLILPLYTLVERVASITDPEVRRNEGEMETEEYSEDVVWVGGQTVVEEEVGESTGQQAVTTEFEGRTTEQETNQPSQNSADRVVDFGQIPNFFNPGNRSKALAMGILLLLPLSIITAVHGQTMWTDDAAIILSKNMADSEDFLFVADSTLGVHWLYTFRPEIDPDASRSITGHWRSPDSGWNDELANSTTIPHRGNLTDVNWVVTSPGVEWREPPTGWSRFDSGRADFMNGGGEWIIFQKTTN
jgi:hypothetical protein